jgi:uncharacterized protein YdcH (DUF465 family)
VSKVGARVRKMLESDFGVLLLSPWHNEFSGLLAEIDRLESWKALIDASPDEESRRIAIERFQDSDANKPIVDAWKAEVAKRDQENENLRRERYALKDLLSVFIENETDPNYMEWHVHDKLGIDGLRLYRRLSHHDVRHAELPHTEDFHQ